MSGCVADGIMRQLAVLISSNGKTSSQIDVLILPSIGNINFHKPSTHIADTKYLRIDNIVFE